MNELIIRPQPAKLTKISLPQTLESAVTRLFQAEGQNWDVSIMVRKGGRIYALWTFKTPVR